MDKEKLKELLAVHKQKFLARQGLVRRDIQSEIARFIPHKEIVLISGVRRSGKSSLLRLVCDDILADPAVPKANILYLNFDDERLVSFSIEDFETLYVAFLEQDRPEGRKFLFLDEIQNVKGWEKWLNRLHEFEDVKIFVTGSNAALLSSEISTALTGRNRQIVNLPFSFREFLSFRGYTAETKNFYLREDKLEIRNLFKEYSTLGGFPEVLKYGDTTLLEQYYTDILYRDIIARYGIKNIKEIKELLLFLATNPGTVQSYKSLQNVARIKSIGTVKNYLEALASVYLFYFIDMFDYSIKRQIYNPAKVYCIDTALSNAVNFSFTRNLGHLYENIVFLELKRKAGDLYYWKSHKGREVDFVVKKGLKIVEAIQVCFTLAEEKTRARELRALLEVREELKVDTLTVITDDEEETVSIDGAEIRVIPLWKWLIT